MTQEQAKEIHQVVSVSIHVRDRHGLLKQMSEQYGKKLRDELGFRHVKVSHAQVVGEDVRDDLWLMMEHQPEPAPKGRFSLIRMTNESRQEVVSGDVTVTDKLSAMGPVIFACTFGTVDGNEYDLWEVHTKPASQRVAALNSRLQTVVSQ